MNPRLINSALAMACATLSVAADSVATPILTVALKLLPSKSTAEHAIFWRIRSASSIASEHEQSAISFRLGELYRCLLKFTLKSIYPALLLTRLCCKACIKQKGSRIL